MKFSKYFIVDMSLSLEMLYNCYIIHVFFKDIYTNIYLNIAINVYLNIYEFIDEKYFWNLVRVLYIITRYILREHVPLNHFFSFFFMSDDYEEGFVLDQSIDAYGLDYDAQYQDPEADSNEKQKSQTSASKRQQREFDENRWRDQLISQAGIARPVYFHNKEEDNENEAKVCITVNTEKPDFLLTYDASKFTTPKIDPRFNTNGEIYQIAK